MRPLAAAPVGLQFDHIVIIAMENQNYGDVIGSPSAPFINSLATQGTTIPNYHSYGANSFSGDNINGCSAACYVALISGSDSGVSDGYSCCLTGTTLVDQLQSAAKADALEETTISHSQDLQAMPIVRTFSQALP